MRLGDKLEILADAAKYDASCASSGAAGRHSLKSKGVGSTEAVGICHSYAPDGRCISLLKILLTNFCIFDCQYCVNRNSSNVRRARFTVNEIVSLTLDFYKRNYIEGLFLSSGIIQSPDYTMEQIVRVAKALREDHRFQGYIHLKTIPDASADLLHDAGRYADRLSVNVELPTDSSLKTLAPEKDLPAIKRSMAGLRLHIDEAREDRRAPRFSPGGQSTQMVVGADKSSDETILKSSANLYSSYRLSRVYYSAFSPIPDASRFLPSLAPPLMREHRLYQADWLLRFYRFDVSEIIAGAPADGSTAGMLDLEVDPKTAWALNNRHWFPVDLNRAGRTQMLRVPGLGVRTVERLLAIRREQKIRLDDLLRLRVSLKKVLSFVEVADHRPRKEPDSQRLRQRFLPPPIQGDLFGSSLPAPSKRHRAADFDSHA